jgi:hypothetical protein
MELLQIAKDLLICELARRQPLLPCVASSARCVGAGRHDGVAHRGKRVWHDAAGVGEQLVGASRQGASGAVAVGVELVFGAAPVQTCLLPDAARADSSRDRCNSAAYNRSSISILGV